MFRFLACGLTNVLSAMRQPSYGGLWKVNRSPKRHGNLSEEAREVNPTKAMIAAPLRRRFFDEAIRATKPGGVIFFAFISVYAIMYANYLQGNWAAGKEENFTDDYRIRHFNEVHSYVSRVQKLLFPSFSRSIMI